MEEGGTFLRTLLLSGGGGTNCAKKIKAGFGQLLTGVTKGRFTERFYREARNIGQ